MSDIFFCYRPIGGEWASKDRRKYYSARKIPPSGKWPLGYDYKVRFIAPILLSTSLNRILTDESHRVILA